MTGRITNRNRVLLTGLPGSGKTTLVRQVCEVLKAKNIPVMGFYTEELRNQAKSRIGFDIVTLDGKRRRLARTIDAVKPGEHSKFRVGNYVVFVNEFESLAMPLFNTKLENAIFVLDEIGKMEMFSKAFVKSVTDLFNLPTVKILATIPVARGKSLPLVEKLRNDPLNSVITVDKGNRDNLTTDILNMLDVEGYTSEQIVNY